MSVVCPCAVPSSALCHGLTETRVGEGTFVRDFNLRSYFTELYRLKLLGRNPNEINDMRAILQLGSVRLAMTDSISQEKIGKLEELFHQMEAAADRGDLPKFHELDSDFHRLICSLGNNELLFLIYDAIAELTDDVMHHNVEKSVAAFQGFSRIMEHHKELVESTKPVIWTDSPKPLWVPGNVPSLITLIFNYQ